MRSILFLLPQFSGGGAERVSLNLLIELYNSGYSVKIIVFNNVGPLKTMVPSGVLIYSLDSGSLKRSIAPLIGKIRYVQPDVIFSTLGYINIALLSIRWVLPKKTKIWVREANLPSISLLNNPNPFLMPILYRLLYKYADRVICTSIIMRDEFVSDFMVPKKNLNILPNLIDVQKIRKLAFPVKRFDKGGVCYVASGRLTFQKGFDLLLNWFVELKDKSSTLVILGGGDLKDELMAKARLLNMQKQVKFLGFCNNPWQWYAGADAYLLSSRWEGMPNSALESLACGTPVIATKESGGIKEVITESGLDNSIIVSTNAQEFIEAMSKVKIKDKNYTSESLLPGRYRKERVINVIKGWLDESK
jgi:glycosyltransferase involved in cell wall biosynthesis